MRVTKSVSAVFATALAGSLALGGFTAATAFAADAPRSEAVRQAPLPNAHVVDQQAQLLSTTSEALQPVADVLRDVLKDPLTREEGARHAKAVREALAPFIAAGSQQDAQQQDAQQQDAAKQQLVAKAATELQRQVDALIDASVRGSQQETSARAESTVAASVNLLASLVASGQLPEADLEGLRNMPQVPEAQTLPDTLDPKAQLELTEPSAAEQYQVR